MPAQIFGAQAAVSALNRAFANTSVGNAVFNNQVATATSQLAAGANAADSLSYTAFAKQFGTAYAGQTAAALSTLLLTNMGVLPSTNDAIVAPTTGLVDQLTAYITSVGTSNVGIVALQLSSLLSAAEGSSVYGAAATAWNNEVTNAFTYSSNSANANSSSGDAAVNAGQTFTLTTSADIVSGSTGVDTFVGVIGTNGLTTNGTTFNPGDNLNGGAGDDVLNINVSGTHTADLTRSSITLNSIEKVLFSNFQTDNAFDDILDMSTATGVTTVGTAASSATGDVQFTNVKNTVATEMVGGADVAVVYASTLLTATDDAVTLNAMGAGTSAASADFLTWNGASTGVAETLNIKSSVAANYLTINGNNDHKTINVTGDQNLSLGTLDTTVTKLDASAFTGKLSVTAGLSNIALTGGTADDTINLAATLTSADTIDGGAGTDTVAISDADTLTATTGARVSNMETLRADAGDATAYSASAIAGVTKVVANHNTNDNVTFSGMGAATALQLTATLAGANDTVTASLATNTTADAITVTIGATSATSGTGSVAGTLTLDNYETITLNSTGGTTAAVNSINSVVSSSATKIVATGDRALTLTTLSGSGVALKTLDASAMTANLNMGTALSGSGTTLTGGAGNDTLVGGTGADSVVGGAGNDDITGANGNDTLAGGEGNDSITGGTANDVITGDAGNDTIAGAAGNDNLSGGEGNDTFTINTWSDITAADTIDGGAGTDTVSTTDTTVTLNSAATGGLKNLESVTIAGGATTVTITDVGIGSFNNDITIRDTGNAGNTVNASGVLSSTSKVTFAGGTGADTYNVGNGIDNASTGSGGDTVSVGTLAFLSASDTLNGGSGTDSLTIAETTAGTLTVSAAQLTNVTGFESFDFNTTNGTTVNYVLTLTDTVLVGNNAAGAFTVTRGADDDGTTKIDASAVTSGYSLTLTSSADGGTPNDTLIGGAGNDSITGGAGSDSLTGGAGNDGFVVTGLTQAANGSDTITDFSFGTSTTSVDTITIDVTSTTKVFGTASAGITAAAGTEILIMDQAGYQDASAAQTAVRTALGANDNAAEAIIIWQDTLGNLNLSVYADASADATANGTLQTSMIKFVGLTITNAGSLINAGDFNLI